MSDQNRFHFTGRLTRDIQLSYTPSQTAVGDVGVAIGRKYKDKEETVFLDLQLWGAVAETWNKYFRKGSFVIASGRLTMDQWTDKQGQKRTKLRCVVEDFTFPPKPQNGTEPPAGGNYEDAPPSGCASGQPIEDVPF